MSLLLLLVHVYLTLYYPFGISRPFHLITFTAIYSSTQSTTNTYLIIIVPPLLLQSVMVNGHSKTRLHLKKMRRWPALLMATPQSFSRRTLTRDWASRGPCC